MKKYIITKWIIFAIALAINVFIIANSFIGGDASSKESGSVAEIIENIINTLSPETINPSNVDDFRLVVRKVVGHLMLFAASGVFTSLAVYFFLLVQKWYKFYWSIAISLGTGFLLAGVSELVQFFTDGRYGSWSDVGIDFGGFLLGSAVVILILYLRKILISPKQPNI